MTLRTPVAATLLLAACLGSALRGQHGLPTVPPGGDPPGAIEPVLLLPRPGDPEYPAKTTCPWPRFSGLFAFTDPQDPADPNDDREYMVACRSDGILLVDATPDRTPVAANVTPHVPAGFHREWIPENVLSLPGSPGEDYLNGVPTGPMYCPTPVQFTTGHATNREVVAYHDRLADRFFLYCISNLRDGLWVIELQRDPGSPHGVLTHLRDAWLPLFPQVGHTISIDPVRGFLIVSTVATMNVLTIRPPLGSPSQPAFLFPYYTRPTFNEIGSGPHDALVHDGRLYVSCWTTSAVDVFDLASLDPGNPAAWRRVRRVVPPRIGNNPALSTFVRAVHSVWVDDLLVPPTMWLLEENPGNNMDAADITGINYENSPPTPDVFQARTQQQLGNVAGRIPNKTNNPVAMVHHLRAEHRTGFLAHYTDGIDLVDISNPASLQILASYDTTALAQNAPSPWFLIDHFLGVWDVAPNQDSGLVYATGGREGAFVFRVNQGHVNRYWNATPFGRGTYQRPGVHPRIVAPLGPPRASRPFVIRDGNYRHYSRPGMHRWTLYLTTRSPSVPFHDRQRKITLNVDPSQSVVIHNAPGVDVFGFMALPLMPGQRLYAQMVVEEFDPRGNADASVWSASRGTWFGIAGP